MRKFKDLFISSYKEIKNVRCITLMAMFGAISVVLGTLTLLIGDFLKVGFTFLPNEFIYYLFGPAVGAFFGAAMDILTFIVKPLGTFFPGFTISAILSGLMFGFLLYKKPISLKRIFFAKLLHMVVINMLLNTYWLSILLGDAYAALFPIRALKAVIMLPIETLLVFALIKGVEASGVLKHFYGQQTKAS
jgi:ECF transporter S component (folate family)